MNTLSVGDKAPNFEVKDHQGILRKLSDRYSQAHWLCIRPHPSENFNKYEEFIRKHNLQNVIVSGRNLLEDLYFAGFVFGDSSYAMHLATLVGKNIVCSIPISNVLSSLPHPSLKYLRDMDV